jgi:hypothetical protein
MIKYIGMGFGVVVITVFASIVVLADEYPFGRRGDMSTASTECKTAIRTGIQSIYPDAQIARVQEYYCARAYKEDPATGGDPTRWRCRARYEQTITVAQWLARRLAGERIAEAVRVGDVVVLQRSTPATDLTTEQKTAHAALLTQCLGGVEADNLLDFTARKVGAEVMIQSNYVDKVSTREELFDLDKEGKVLFVLQPAP